MCEDDNVNKDMHYLGQKKQEWNPPNPSHDVKSNTIKNILVTSDRKTYLVCYALDLLTLFLERAKGARASNAN